MISAAGVNLSLASNPFATRFVRPGKLEYQFAGRSKPEDCGFVEIVQQIKKHSGGVIVGPHGSGKSTLLASLDRFLRPAYLDVARIQLHAPSCVGVWARAAHARRNESKVKAHQIQLPMHGLLVIDGAEQLSRIARIRLQRRARLKRQSLLLTSHTPINGMVTLLETRLDASLVTSLTETLLRDSTREVVQLVRGQLSSRDLTKLANVREFWFEMYDLVQHHRLRSP